MRLPVFCPPSLFAALYACLHMCLQLIIWQGTALQGASWLSLRPFHPDSIMSFVLPDSLSSLCETFHPFFFFFFAVTVSFSRPEKRRKTNNLQLIFIPAARCELPVLATVSSYSSVTHNLLSAAPAGFTTSPCYNTPQQDGTQGVAAAAHPSLSSGSKNS